jgi:hypothetical protein
MDMLKELKELKDTIANEIVEANKKIRKAGGDLNTGDIEMIDKLTHSMKSLVTTCAMLEADEGYSGDYMPYYSRNDEPERRYSRNYSGTYGREGRNESRYSRNGYSRGVDWNEHLRMMMDEAPDEATRMDIKKLMDRMAG